MSSPKTTSRRVTIDAATFATLAERAKAHRVTRPKYLRALIAGVRPGGGRGEAAAAADIWWDTLPPARRAQIHAWVDSKAPSAEDDPDQLDIHSVINPTSQESSS